VSPDPDGGPIPLVPRVIERDRFFTPAEALEYGLIDRVLQDR
jgi:ATP-dependent protease ClpP protease subunit